MDFPDCHLALPEVPQPYCPPVQCRVQRCIRPPRSRPSGLLPLSPMETGDIVACGVRRRQCASPLCQVIVLFVPCSSGVQAALAPTSPVDGGAGERAPKDGAGRTHGICGGSGLVSGVAIKGVLIPSGNLRIMGLFQS